MKPLPPLPSLSDIVRMYGLSARQQLSQNFLLDMNLVRRVARACGPLQGKTVLEVGAGPGTLTRALLEAGAHVVALEKDFRFEPALRMLQEAVGEDRMTVVMDDALTVDEGKLLADSGAKPSQDWSSDECNVHLVGNLPFAVSTELLIKWLHQMPSRSGPFEFGRVPLTLLFQKEIADRICASPSSGEYGRLSVMSQHCATTIRRFDIRGKAFVPPPKVDAGLVTLIPLVQPQVSVNLNSLEYVLRQVFGQRRKMLRNAVSTLEMGEDILERSALDETRRPDQLNITQWAKLANAYDANQDETHSDKI